MQGTWRGQEQPKKNTGFGADSLHFPAYQCLTLIPEFPHLRNRDENNACFTGFLWGLNDTVHIKSLVYHWASSKHSINFRNYYEQLNSKRRRWLNNKYSQVFHSLPIIRVIFPENEDMRGRGTQPTCSDDWPKAEPSLPLLVKNARPASKETSVCGLNNGKPVLSVEMNTFSAYKWKKHFSAMR